MSADDSSSRLREDHSAPGRRTTIPLLAFYLLIPACKRIGGSAEDSSLKKRRRGVVSSTDPVAHYGWAPNRTCLSRPHQMGRDAWCEMSGFQTCVVVPDGAGACPSRLPLWDPTARHGTRDQPPRRKRAAPRSRNGRSNQRYDAPAATRVSAKASAKTQGVALHAAGRRRLAAAIAEACIRYMP